GGQGLLQSFGWGVAFDTNQNPADYEWLIMLDGISQTEVIQLWQNTIQGTLGSPTDKPEILQTTVPLAGNYAVSPADSAINGDADYFLDWRFPYSSFKAATGLTDSSPIRLFFGSSSSANNLSQSGADLVGGSDLYSGLSDISTVLGTKPTTGMVRFVAALSGAGDVTQITAGDTLFIRVDDADVNNDITTLQTVTVTLVASSGDTATVILTETGVNTGIFTGSIITQENAPVAADGLLQVAQGATVNAIYVDGIDASYHLNQTRTDAVSVRSFQPLITLVKSANPATGAPGQEILFTVYFRNTGVGAAANLMIIDSIPPFTDYEAGSLRIGSAASTYETATPLSDAADTDGGQCSDNSVVFAVGAVAGDDGAVNSGADEGKVYFKVKIQ
ncbi:MAG: DUF11 domain-containing protein, partial [Victivallaceae bacterium]|nr:DUF11 domain-containing protein [Victivallaceae bacterium]